MSNKDRDRESQSLVGAPPLKLFKMAALILLSKCICLLPGFPDSTNVPPVETNVFREHYTSNLSNNGERVSKAEGKVEPGLYILVWE